MNFVSSITGPYPVRDASPAALLVDRRIYRLSSRDQRYGALDLEYAPALQLIGGVKRLQYCVIMGYRMCETGRRYSAATRSSCLYCTDMESRLRDLTTMETAYGLRRIWTVSRSDKSVDVHYRHTKNGCFGCHGCEVSHDDAHGGSAVSG